MLHMDHVCFGSKAGICAEKIIAALPPESGHVQGNSLCPLWPISGHRDVSARSGDFGLTVNNAARAKSDRNKTINFDYYREGSPTSQRILRHVVNCETKRHDCAYSTAGGAMITIPELASEALGSHLAAHMGRRFGSDAELVELVQSAARLAIDCIGNSDALYHNVEHTTLVTLCGYDILKGRRLLRETNASDFAHIIVACLFHDIGYVRGILNDDSA